MDNEKIEIKIQSRWEYYVELIKKKLIKPIFGILILLGVLYIGFYFLLFLVLFFGISYFIYLVFRLLLLIIKNLERKN